MTKKDYNRFAKLFKQYCNELPLNFIGDFMAICKEDNPQFNIDKFVAAIAPEEGETAR